MKEKINLVQLTNNQQKEVTAGATIRTVPCHYLEYYPVCKCKVPMNLCAQVSYLYPACRD
jgi:hypothetical protein